MGAEGCYLPRRILDQADARTVNQEKQDIGEDQFSDKTSQELWCVNSSEHFFRKPIYGSDRLSSIQRRCWQLTVLHGKVHWGGVYYIGEAIICVR